MNLQMCNIWLNVYKHIPLLQQAAHRLDEELQSSERQTDAFFSSPVKTQKPYPILWAWQHTGLGTLEADNSSPWKRQGSHARQSRS